MKGIVVSLIFVIAAVSYTNSAPVDTPRNTSENNAAIVAKASARVSKRNYRVDPYATIRSYIHTHRKRRHNHKRHRLHSRLHKRHRYYPVKDRVQYFGKENKADHEDFEINNGEVFEHGAVPDLRRTAATPLGGSEHAITANKRDNDTEALARNATQQMVTEGNHTTDLIHPIDQGSGDGKNTSDNNSGALTSSSNDTHVKKHNMTKLDGKLGAKSVKNLKKDKKILVSDHAVFVLNNDTNVDISTREELQNVSMRNQTESDIVTLSPSNDLKEKRNNSVSDALSKSSTHEESTDIESLNNLNRLIKDLISLDKSIYLVEHTLNMADNEDDYKQYQVNNERHFGRDNVTELDGNSTSLEDHAPVMNNKSMEEVKADVENLVLHCLGFASGETPSTTSSLKDTGSHTSSGDLHLSCSDLDISKEQRALLDSLESSTNDAKKRNSSMMHTNALTGSVDGKEKQLIKTDGRLNSSEENHLQQSTKMHGNKTNMGEQMQSFSKQAVKTKMKNLQSINESKPLHHSVNKSHKSFESNVSLSNHITKDKEKQVTNNMTAPLFQNYTLQQMNNHFATDQNKQMADISNETSQSSGVSKTVHDMEEDNQILNKSTTNENLKTPQYDTNETKEANETKDVDLKSGITEPTNKTDVSSDVNTTNANNESNLQALNNLTSNNQVKNDFGNGSKVLADVDKVVSDNYLLPKSDDKSNDTENRTAYDPDTKNVINGFLENLSAANDANSTNVTFNEADGGSFSNSSTFSNVSSTNENIDSKLISIGNTTNLGKNNSSDYSTEKNISENSVGNVDTAGYINQNDQRNISENSVEDIDPAGYINHDDQPNITGDDQTKITNEKNEEYRKRSNSSKRDYDKLEEATTNKNISIKIPERRRDKEAAQSSDQNHLKVNEGIFGNPKPAKLSENNSPYGSSATEASKNTKENKFTSQSLEVEKDHDKMSDKKKARVVFHDYLMNSGGQSVHVGNMTKSHSNEDNFRFFRKHEYGTGTLITQLLKSRISAYKTSNVRNGRKRVTMHG